MNINYFACLGDEEEDYNEFGYKVLQYCSDDNNVCASNTTYSSDYGTITTKEDDATSAEGCAPLINSIAEFGNSEPLLRRTQHTSGKSILQANNK